MARKFTSTLLEMIDEGIIDKDFVIGACLKWMSEDDVREMMFANEMLVDNDDFDEPAEERSAEELLEDFNYVGSRHHY